MKRKIISVIMALTLLLALGLNVALSQESQEAKADTPKMLLKLDEVLANQAQMLQQLKEIKQELEIVKVRATRH